MNYLKKIIKKWKMINKLEEELRNLQICHFLSGTGNRFRNYYSHRYFSTKKALNKLHSL